MQQFNNKFTIKCGQCGKERELDHYSRGDRGGITLEKIGDSNEGDVEKFDINCSCGNWAEFNRF